ncbi:MAG: YigZ family protein [bacterium]|nr:YigZ family protein [bacterium]
MIESYLSDDYWTLSGPGTAHTRVLGSRFSAIAFHVADESELESRLMELKKTEFDATHHCWAHVIRKDHELRERVSDDGRPKGHGQVAHSSRNSQAKLTEHRGYRRSLVRRHQTWHRRPGTGLW